MLYSITVKLIVFILRVFFRFEIIGKENIPSQGAFILASNHTSYFDPPILAAGCYCRRLNFLAKEELFSHRLFGWYIRQLGAFPIKREGSDISAIKEAIKRIRKGQPMVIFPEGGRSKDGTLREGLPGIALLASREHIPVVPAFISGAHTAMASGLRQPRFNKISVRFGKPLLFSPHKGTSYEAIVDSIMSAIKQLAFSDAAREKQ